MAPAESIKAANMRVYASTTHCWPAIPPLREYRIAGSAMFTADTSMVITVNPRSEATNATPARRGGAGALAGGAVGRTRFGRRRRSRGADNSGPCPWAEAVDGEGEGVPGIVISWTRQAG
ncbi:hypothetical protein GCM10009864_74700 [Streptomyces lunalinharesii]|uniref:Uncharacterized protein n=1 Tax=Streptomyces lunalinharesii TaxID=333384 RepID=A0ABN3T0S1_9ACTN